MRKTPKDVNRVTKAITIKNYWFPAIQLATSFTTRCIHRFLKKIRKIPMGDKLHFSQ